MTTARLVATIIICLVTTVTILLVLLAALGTSTMVNP